MNVGLFVVSQADSAYRDDAGASVDLEIVDTGGMAGLMGLAGWMGVESEREDASGYERTRQVDGRLVHEESRVDGGTNEFAVVVGERFLVTARSMQLDVDALLAGVSNDVELDRLDALANQNRAR